MTDDITDADMDDLIEAVADQRAADDAAALRAQHTPECGWHQVAPRGQVAPGYWSGRMRHGSCTCRLAALRPLQARSRGMRKHPAAVAWETFAANNSSLFVGRAEGQYLENRLRQAFSQGWDRAEQAVKDALTRPIGELIATGEEDR